MTSTSNDSPRDMTAPDLILLALFQSRLRERSKELDDVIESQRRRLSSSWRTGRLTNDASDGELARLSLAEKALSAVQHAEELLANGKYGVCDECRQPISWDVLLESPEQTTCRACDPLGSVTRLLQQS